MPKSEEEEEVEDDLNTTVSPTTALVHSLGLSNLSEQAPKYTESEVTEYKDRLSELGKERDELLSTIESLKQQQRRQQAEAQESISSTQREKERCVAEKDRLLQVQLSTIQTKHTEYVTLLKTQHAEERGRLEKELKTISAEHASEIDEMIGQLDKIVAEHESETKTLFDLVQQKEVIISALGVQLAEQKNKDASYESELAKAQEEAAAYQSEAETLQETLTQTKRNHTIALEEEASKTKLAVARVTKDLRAAAESQFDGQIGTTASSRTSTGRVRRSCRK